MPAQINELPPQYYVFQENGVHYTWMFDADFRRRHIFKIRMAHLQRALSRDEDGNVVVDHEKLTKGLRLILRSELPDDPTTMTLSHMELRDGKFVVPNINHREHQEDLHDQDVNLLIRQWNLLDFYTELLKYLDATAGDNRLKLRQLGTKFHKVLADSTNLFEFRIEEAYLKALGEVKIGAYPEIADRVGYSIQYVSQFTVDANAAAKAIVAAMQADDTFTHPLYDASKKLAELIEADASKSRDATNRAFPWRFKVVETLSSPADVQEVTAASVLTKINTALTPL